MALPCVLSYLRLCPGYALVIPSLSPASGLSSQQHPFTYTSSLVPLEDEAEVCCRLACSSPPSPNLLCISAWSLTGLRSPLRSPPSPGYKGALFAYSYSILVPTPHVPRAVLIDIGRKVCRIMILSPSGLCVLFSCPLR